MTSSKNEVNKNKKKIYFLISKLLNIKIVFFYNIYRTSLIKFYVFFNDRILMRSRTTFYARGLN